MNTNDPGLKKDDILKGLHIEALSSDGSGITKIEGYPVFIKDALPGDIVTAKLMKVKKNMAFARLMKTEKASPDRVAPKCKNARPCGGCSIQELSYEKQLEYKDDKVYNCLLRIGGIPAKILDAAHEEPVGMDKPWRYRNKAQYPIGTDRDGRIISGFYAGRTHHIVDRHVKELNLNLIVRTIFHMNGPGTSVGSILLFTADGDGKVIIFVYLLTVKGCSGYLHPYGFRFSGL